jgi:hypothetical protein
MEDQSKNNDFLAEFMGYQILHKKFQVKSYNSSNEYYWDWTEGKVLCDPQGEIVENYEQEPLTGYDDLGFSSSWDLLIPVWHKIITEIWDAELDESEHLQDTLDLEAEFLTRVSRDAPIEATEIVIKTIKWFKSIETE